jgi:hypothetical protein
MAHLNQSDVIKENEMKSRKEMIYEMTLAAASNYEFFYNKALRVNENFKTGNVTEEDVAVEITAAAVGIVDWLEGVLENDE